MLKYVTKLAMEIVPSVVATILGAYIVNHYINGRPATPAVAVMAPAAADAAKLDGAKADAKPAETSAEISNIPGAGIKAKGIAEKSVTDKAAVEKPSEAKESKAETTKSETKPTETASLPPERSHGVTSKPAARAAETPAAQDERRDAADLARAAIERLRASEGAHSSDTHSSDTARPTGDAPRVVMAAPPVSPVRPLPPPISVSTPVDGAPYAAGTPSYTGSIQVDGRLTPPAEIPAPPPARPLDLRADRDPSLKDQMSNVADDMVSAAKSVFHSVLPK